jgi:hypothetical protein
MIEFSEENIEAWLQTDEGKASMANSLNIIQTRIARNKYWAERIAKYIESLSDEDLSRHLYRLLKWEKAYEERWFEINVHEETMLFNRVIEAFRILGKDFEEKEDLIVNGYIYKNYIFKCYQEQGFTHKILDISKSIENELIFKTT